MISSGVLAMYERTSLSPKEDKNWEFAMAECERATPVLEPYRVIDWGVALEELRVCGPELSGSSVDFHEDPHPTMLTMII